MAAPMEEKGLEMKYPQGSQPVMPVLMTEGSFTGEASSTPEQKQDRLVSPNEEIDESEIDFNEEMLNEKMGRLMESEHAESRDELKYVPPVQDPYTRSVKYMEEHNIMQIFQHLTAEIVYHKPPDPLQHMLEELHRMVEERDLKRKEALKNTDII